jgi:hypothetical protein
MQSYGAAGSSYGRRPTTPHPGLRPTLPLSGHRSTMPLSGPLDNAAVGAAIIRACSTAPPGSKPPKSARDSLLRSAPVISEMLGGG